MASLLEKIGTLVSANLNDLVNRALEQNSPAVFDQYIRDIEGNLAKLEDAAAAVGGEVKGIRRRLEDKQEEVERLDLAIDAFLLAGNNTAATASQAKLNSANRMVESYSESLSQQDGEFKNLLSAKVKLEAKLATMKAEREEIAALLELAKSKELVVRTVKDLKNLAGDGDADMARIANGIRARLDKASTASELQSASLEAQIDDVLGGSELDAQLAARKAKLGLSKSEEESSAPQAQQVRFEGTMTNIN